VSAGTYVPVEVAVQWVERNPGVVATDEPEPRPRSRPFYTTWSVGLIIAAIALCAVLATNGREDFILLWAAAPLLFFAGLSAAWRILPPGYIRFERNES
jgi:hypothetical protein